LREIAVDFIHAEEFVVGNIGLGKQTFICPGNAPGNRVNSNFTSSTLVQCIAELTHFVLRLRNCS